MKQLLILLFPLLAFSSCKESPKASETPPTPVVESDATVAELAQEMVDALAPMVEIVTRVKDVPTAEKARAEVNEVADQVVLLLKQVEQLPVPTEEEKRQIEKDMTEQTKASQRELRRLFIEHSYISDAEVLANLTVGMNEFSEKMTSVQPIIERYFTAEPKAADEVIIEAEEVAEEIEVPEEIIEEVASEEPQ